MAFQKVADSIGAPAKPVETNLKVNSAEMTEKLAEDDPDLKDKKYDVPKLSELGVKKEELEECKFPGGETEGLRRLAATICESRSGWLIVRSE